MIGYTYGEENDMYYTDVVGCVLCVIGCNVLRWDEQQAYQKLFYGDLL